MTLATLVEGCRPVKLGDVAEIDRKAVVPSEVEDGDLFVGLEHISGEGEFAGVKQVARGEIGSTKFSFGPQHVLYGKLRPYLRKIARPSFSGVCSTDILPIRPGPEVDRDFLFHFLRSHTVVELATRRSSGANLPRLSPQALLEFPLRLPTLAEQRRIAAILDKANAIYQKRRRAFGLIEDLLRSAFIYLFGDPLSNPKGWPQKRLENLCVVRRGASPRPIADYLGGRIPWIKIGDATRDDDMFLRKTSESVTDRGAAKSLFVKSGSLILANSGVSLGFARILAIDGCIHDGWLSLQDLDASIDKVFLLMMLNVLTGHLRAIAPEGTQPNLNTAIVKVLPTIVPPLAEQRKFGEFVSKCLQAKQTLGTAMISAQALSKSFSEQAFSGGRFPHEKT